MLQIRNLSFSHNQREILYYSDAVFSIGITVITGVSGGGKSTFFDLVAKKLFPKTGKIFWDGTDIGLINDDVYFRDIIAMVPQDAALALCFNLRDYIRILRYMYQLKDYMIAYYLEKLYLNHLLDQEIRYCSGGEKYRISLCIAILKDTPLICLDEPTAHLDEKNKKNVMTLLKELENKVILIISHDQLLLDHWSHNNFVVH